MMFGPVFQDGSARAAVRGFLIGCCLGVLGVVTTIGYVVYRVALSVWSGQ
jgi:hypothetical protein